MRIAFNATFWGQEGTGSGQYLHHLLEALRRVAPEHDLLSLRPAYNAAMTCPEDAPELLPTPLDGRSENLAKVWFEQRAFPRASHRRGADLAHVPFFGPPWRSHEPLVVTIHDLIPLMLPEYAGSRAVRLYMRLVSSCARRADMVLTDSTASARDIRRLLRIPDERLRITYLAAEDTYRPVPPTERASVLSRLGLDVPYLLYLGGFDCRKNVIGLLQAFAQARGRISEVCLAIAGRLPASDSAFVPDPRPVAEALGLGESVRWLGWVDEDDKPALYSGATAFCFPSHYEGFGLPVLEAISCGTPAIVGGGSSLDEIAGPGGLVVSPDDLDALAEAMVALCRDAALRQELASAGLGHAAGFSWERTAQETLDAYDAVMARRA